LKECAQYLKPKSEYGGAILYFPFNADKNDEMSPKNDNTRPERRRVNRFAVEHQGENKMGWQDDLKSEIEKKERSISEKTEKDKQIRKPVVAFWEKIIHLNEMLDNNTKLEYFKDDDSEELRHKNNCYGSIYLPYNSTGIKGSKNGDNIIFYSEKHHNLYLVWQVYEDSLYIYYYHKIQDSSAEKILSNMILGFELHKGLDCISQYKFDNKGFFSTFFG